ncbi:MAG TPA: DUF1552 domain-containing protein, partial [Vicinamibacterales bacterium]|nr:DUF1552 domain-containing protein [Vicinamibacterales bacterium]
MFISKRSISRRAVLRGVGATVALPFLDAMVPALTAQARTAANPVRRFGTVFVGLGERPSHWRPATEGVNFEFSPILKPLEGFRDHVTVVSDLATPINGHAPTAAAWSTGVLAKATIAEDVLLGPSIDQLVAKTIGRDTVFPSLEVCTEDVTGYLGGCDPAYACAYINTTSWANPTTPLPMEINPRTLFERLFGRAGTAAQRLAAQQTDRSILDSVRDDVRELQAGLGRRDQGRLSEYLDNVREIEQRIQRAEKQSATSVEVPNAPVGIPETFSEHMMLMFDLLAVAWQADMTRVFSYMLNRDVSQRVYPEIAISEPHHAMSHHGKDTKKLEGLVKLNTWQVSLFAKFVDRLAKTPDGDGSLLDHSVIFWGSGMSESDLHFRLDVPTLLVGKGNGLYKGNRHQAAG